MSRCPTYPELRVPAGPAAEGLAGPVWTSPRSRWEGGGTAPQWEEGCWAQTEQKLLHPRTPGLEDTPQHPFKPGAPAPGNPPGWMAQTREMCLPIVLETKIKAWAGSVSSEASPLGLRMAVSSLSLHGLASVSILFLLTRMPVRLD